MTRRVHVFPPSNDTHSNRPVTTSGKVAMVTIFEGATGLMAMASSASLPCITLASKLVGTDRTAAPVAAPPDASTATAANADVETVKSRSIRRSILASRRRTPNRNREATLRRNPGDRQGEYAGEHVHSDVVLGPVVHRGERHDAAVLELPEGELRFGLGPVAGDHLGGGPVVVAGDQDVLAEQFLFQGGAGCLVDGPGQAQAGGLVTVQLPGDDAPHPGLAGNCLDLGFDLAPGAAGLAACQGGGKFGQLAAGLVQGGAVEPGGLAFVQVG